MARKDDSQPTGMPAFNDLEEGERSPTSMSEANSIAMDNFDSDFSANRMTSAPAEYANKSAGVNDALQITDLQWVSLEHLDLVLPATNAAPLR